MSNTHLYLSLIPEALIASMLTPQAFGSYYAISPRHNAHGEAIFFQVRPDFRSDQFPFHLVDERCVPDAAGNPKETVYLSIYRVLERIPVAALGSLFLTTDDGRTLELPRSDEPPETRSGLRLYQEISPVNPMVASRLAPDAFCRFITDPASPLHVPRIVFSELILQGLRDDPERGAADDLPYPNIQHLRDVLKELREADKPSKMVVRQVRQSLLYRTVGSGFYVGDREAFAFYRFPTREVLDRNHHAWWRSAQTLGESS